MPFIVLTAINIMGVKGLYKVISAASDSIKVTSVSDYAGKVIGIDASLIIHQCCNAMSLTGPDGQRTEHITGVFYKTAAIMRAGVTPLYVFDGPHQVAKAEAIKKRQTGESAHKHNKPTSSVYADCQKLLALMGVQYLVAPAEADAYLAALCKANIIYAVASEDNDMLVFGAPRLIRDFTPSARPTEYSLEGILRELAITHEQLLHICVLLGSDYGKPIAGYGPVKALAAIRKYGDLYKFSEVTSVNPVVWEYIIREYTQHPIGPLELPVKKERDPALIDYLTTVCGLNKQRVLAALSE